MLNERKENTTDRATLSTCPFHRSSGARAPTASGVARRSSQAAAELSTVEGLNGLSIGRLAEHVGMSKSGLYAHFRSKEELQLATVAVANEILTGVVVVPALDAPEGAQRLLAFCDTFLAHVEQRVFPGGCFLISAAAELSPRPGPVARGDRRELSRMVRPARGAGGQGKGARRDRRPRRLDELGLRAQRDAARRERLLLPLEDIAELERARRGVRERLENLG